ncbi:MAG: phage holin family protein [Actinomycetota bacterium]
MEVSKDNGGGSGVSAGQRPFGVLVASAIEGLRSLARSHVELVKLEATEAAAVRGQGVGLLAAAATAAKYAALFAAAAIAAALALVLPTWAAILIVAAVLLAVAGVLALIGRRRLRTAPTPGERTRETLKEDARWAKRQIAR